ncbi:MAG: sigma-70 family RNA polymerase sigma factor [Pirellulaceae bacterium]
MDKRSITPEMRAWIDQSQGMVRAIATKIFSRLPTHVNYDDLVSYGQLGLMQAVYSFQPDKEVTFQTFAYHRIRGAIYDGLGKMSWTSRAISQRIRAERLSAELLEQQIQASRQQENAESLSSDADWLVRTTQHIAVVHLITDSSDDSKSLATTAVDTELPPDEVVEHQELCEVLRQSIAELPETERQLITATYFEGKTLTDAADQLGKSKSWASRVHARILEKLAKSIASHGG